MKPTQRPSSRRRQKPSLRATFPSEPVITIVPSEDGRYAWVIEQEPETPRG